MEQAAQYKQGGNTLGYDGCCGYTCHPHIKADDKDQIQDHIDNAGGKKEIQGPLGIPGRPQDSRAEIVQHGGRHADKKNTHKRLNKIEV